MASGRLRQVPSKAVFYVGEIKQEAILGIDFFPIRNCGFSLTNVVFNLEGEKLKCVNKTIRCVLQVAKHNETLY